MTKLSNAETIDALLPQTQCGLCGYGGCMPYAEAMIDENAAINLCPPGGIETLLKLGENLHVDPTPYLAEMQLKTKPARLATIREAECIGCVKCIQACPVDAILGSAKQMHSIISDECTGCELCIPACPVDCIDLTTVAAHYSPEQARLRYQAREVRKTKEHAQKQQRKFQESAVKRKTYIQAAIERAKRKKQA